MSFKKMQYYIKLISAAALLSVLQVWWGRWEEQAPDHVWPERVPAGAEEELQPPEREPEADAGEEDSRAV